MKMIGKRKKEKEKEKKGTYSSNKSEKKTDRKCIAEEKKGACEKMITDRIKGKVPNNL
jgi:hypothetical protein